MNAKHAAKQKLELTATERSVTGSKVRHLRATGVIPAVLYGKGQEAVNLQVPTKDFDKVFHQAGESTLVYLNVGGHAHPTIIHDIARHPLSGVVIHADFYKVRLDEKIKTMVPVVFVGESPAVKNDGGIFVRNINELEVEALPADLPHEIEVDISSLAKFDDSITLGSIKGHGWTLTGNVDDVVALVQAPKSEEELEAELAAPTTDISAVKDVEKPVEEEVPAEEGEAPPAGGPAPAEAKAE
jgi:large subunit ribosomal protein L25